MGIRVKVDYESCPDYGWTEQWNTPEKYYGCAPKCSHGRPMEYIGGHSWTSNCFIDDECAEVLNYINDPEAFKAGEGNCGVMKQGDQIVPFDEYIKTWGNPNSYVYLWAVAETKCDHCGEWAIKDSLSGIDFYEPVPGHWETGTFTETEVDAMPVGHLRDTLQEMFGNVKEETA